jgi:hypothetical protein
VLAEFIARLSISRRSLHEVLQPLGLADLAVIVSFLAPVGGRASVFCARSGFFGYFARTVSRAGCGASSRLSGAITIRSSREQTFCLPVWDDGGRLRIATPVQPGDRQLS